jgi:hypothetical protein
VTALLRADLEQELGGLLRVELARVEALDAFFQIGPQLLIFRTAAA